MEDNRRVLYDNLLKDYKLTESDLGDFNTFNSMLDDDDNVKLLRSNLIDNKIVGEEDLGDEETFLDLIRQQEATSEDVALPVSEEKTPEEYTEEVIQKNKLTKLGLYNDYSDVSLYDKPELSDESVRQNADMERAENDKFLYEKELELEAKYENDIKETAINTGYPEEFVRSFNMVEKALPTKRRKTGYLAGVAGEFDRGVADVFRTVDGAVRFVKQGVVEGINLAEKAIGKEGAELTSLDDRPTLWSDLADVYDKSADAGYDIPDNVMGDVVGGMARMVPDLAITMVAPEIKLGRVAKLTNGAIKAVPRFPTVLAVKEASAGYMADPNNPFAVPVGAFKGFEEGLVMESMGLIGKEAKMVADGLGAGRAMSETAAAITNGTLFGGHAIVSDPEVYRDGDIDWELAKRRFGSGFGMGLAFHLGGITKGIKEEMSPSASREIANSAIKRGYAEYMTSDREAVRKALTEVKDPRALRKVSNEYWRKAELAESTVEKNQYLMAKTGIDNLISRKMFADYVAKNPDEMKKAIEEDRSLSQKEVEFFNKKIDETVEDYETVNKFNEEIAKIEEKVVEPEKAEIAIEDLQVKADALKEQGEDVTKMTVEDIESRFEALKTETDIVEPKTDEVVAKEVVETPTKETAPIVEKEVSKVEPEIKQEIKEVDVEVDSKINKAEAPKEIKEIGVEPKLETEITPIKKEDLERSNKIAEEIGVLEKRGKDKMAEGFAELAAAFGGKKDIVGEQRASAVKGLRKIAEGAADVALAKGLTVKELVKDYVKRMGMNIPDDVIDEALAEPIVKEVKEEVKVEKQAQPTKESAKELIESEIEKGKEGERRMGKRILLDETKLPRELKDKYEGQGLNKYKKLKDVHAKAIVDELVRSNSTEVLETISTDKSIDQSIRVRVQVELAKEYSKQTEKALKDGDTESADYYADKNLAIVKELSDESSNTGRGLRAYGIAEVTALISPYSASKSYKDAVKESRDEIIERKSTKKAQKKFESEANEMHGKILEEVLKNPEFKKKVEALLKKDKAKEPIAPRKPVAKEKIAEIKVKRKSLIEQWKKERRGEMSASIVGLTNADIEFGARIASTYIEEGYYRASDIANKLIKDFKEAGVKLSEEDALKMIPKEIDGKKLEDMEFAVETEKATTALASRIFGEVVEGKKKNDPLAQMVSTLLGKFKERDVTTKAKPEKKSDIEKISEAIQNKDRYGEVWAEARDKAIEKVESNKKLTEDEIDNAVNRINEAYTSATEFTFTEDQVKKAVKKKMRDMDVRIDDVVKSHYSKQASTREALKRSLIDEAGLSDADAEVLSKSIDKAYSSLLSDKAQKLVTKYVDKKALKRDDKSASMKRKGSIDELIELTNARAFDSKEFKEAFADAHGLPVMSEEAVNYIQGMSDLIQRTPSAVIKGRRVEDLMAYMANLKGVDTKELTDMIWYTHVLSGMTTQLRNIIGAQSNTVGALVVEGIKNPSSMHMIYKGWKHGLKTGKIKALDIGKHGKVGFETRVDVPNIGERVKFKGAESFMNYYKYVTRTMSAFDQLAISEGKEGMARLLTAEAQNINQLKYVTSKKYRDATNKLVDEKLYIDKDSQALFEKQAKEEAKEFGWNKEEQQLRQLELMDEARGTDITEESTTFAERNTGNVMAYGNIGYIVDTISKIFKMEYKKIDKRGDVHRRYIPILNRVAAFTRLPANVATFMMDFVPVVGSMPLVSGEYGSLSRAGSFIGSKQNAKYVRELSPRQRETLWKRQLTGLVAQGLMYALTEPDDDGESAIQITANGTGEFYDKTSDFKPYSIKIGDTWIGYKYTPLMLALAPIGYARDAKKYRNDDSDPLTLAGSAIGAMPSFLGDMTSISAMTDLLKSITDDEGAKGIEKRLKLMAMTVKPYYAPGILRDIEALYDWTAENPNYENLDMYDRMISKAPIASMLLPDGRQLAVNALGESTPIEAPWSEFISKDNENDLEAYHVAQVHKPIRVPSKFSVTLKMKQKNGMVVSRPLTDGFKEDHELWYQFQKIRGQRIAEAIRNAKADGKKGDDYKEYYDSKSREATTYAKQKIWLMTLDKPIDNLDK